jgi:hypothetical protein
MIAKPIILAACTAIILSVAAANAAPCDSSQTANMDIANKAAQELERQQRALGLAEQAKVGGTTAEPLSLSSSATDKDRLATFAARQSRWESRDNQDENAPLPG